MPVFAVALLVLSGATVVAMTTTLPPQAMVIGDGYNILTGNTDGMHWLSGGEDPGIMFAHKVFQIETDKELKNEVAYHNHGTCQSYLSTDVVYSPKSYQDRLLQRVTFDGPQIPSLQGAAFTLSSGYSDVKTETNSHHHVLYDQETSCVVESARYKMSLAQSGQFKLTNEVIADICALPETQNIQAYTAFIDKWGTAPSDVSDGGPLMGAESSYLVDVNSFKSRLRYSDAIGQAYGTLRTGSDASPEPVSLGLTSIDVAFSPQFWQGVEEIYTFCPDNITSTVAAKRQLLQQALQQYAVIKGGEVPPAVDLAIPIRWPSGTYGLPKSTTGCPVEKGLWEEGWLKQIPETQSPDSSWTPNHLDASLAKTSFLLRYCVKTVYTKGLSMDWPKGDYCIFKYHVCPRGFVEGFVRHDDENTNNTNTHGGTLPSGDYGADTLIRYCCRSDGTVYDPIMLPTEKPFYLFRYKHGCQEVKDMTSSEEYLLWDDDDDHPSSTALAGAVHPGMLQCNPPAHPHCGTGTRIYYCYYKRSDPLSIIG